MKRFFLRLLLRLSNLNLLNWIPDSTYLRILWRLKMDYPLILDNPVTYNEKIQWLKLNDRNPLYSLLADKYAVRKYITDTIGSQYLVPLLSIYDCVNEIDWDNLPNQFVLKCNHDSGSKVICKDKSTLDRQVAIKKLSRRFKNNTTYNVLREWPYRNIKRKILCEKYLADETGELPDYKFFCFHGVPKIMLFVTERNSGNPKMDLFDMQFERLNIQVRSYRNSNGKIEKPSGFEEMVKLAQVLSKNIAHVRVDFYNIKGKIYFGEFTFFPGSGYLPFTPKGIDQLWGSWINLW